MRRRLCLAVIVFLGVGFLAGCAGLLGTERRETNAEVMIVSFGETSGELAPCG